MQSSRRNSIKLIGGYVRAALLQDVVEGRLHTMMGCCETSCIQLVSKQSACKTDLDNMNTKGKCVFMKIQASGSRKNEMN